MVIKIESFIVFVVKNCIELDFGIGCRKMFETNVLKKIINSFINGMKKVSTEKVYLRDVTLLQIGIKVLL
jgi:hypothetical protein